MMLIFKAYGMLSSEMIFSCRVNCFCTCLLGELQGRQTMSGERSYVLLCHRFFFLDNNERNWPCQLKESVFASTDKRRKEILPQLWNVVTFDLAIIFSTIIGRSFIVFTKKRFKLCLIWIKKFECVGFFKTISNLWYWVFFSHAYSIKCAYCYWISLKYIKKE